MAGVCIMLEKRPKKDKNKQENYWEPSLKLLAKSAKFMLMLQNYKKNSIPEKVITKMSKFLELNKKDFNPEQMVKASNACVGITKWCLAIYEYHFVYKKITPLRL
jgi:hypothetical protein